MYNLTKDVVIQNLAKAKSHSFTTDAWSSSTIQSFITTTVHYIVECELHSNVLDIRTITCSHTGERLCEEMIITEAKWGLREVKGVSDNASNIRNAFKIQNIPHIGCFAHTINLSVCKALEDTSVKKVLGKTRRLVAIFKTSYL